MEETDSEREDEIRIFYTYVEIFYSAQKSYLS